MINRALVIIILLISTLHASAQFVNFGQDRASIRWKQIKTENFQIIYPDFFEGSAQKAANIYQRLYNHANTLRLKPKRISMIMHADGGISNGNVSLAPRKSELYTTPPQEPTDSWLEHLCVHEFRHVIQFDKVNQGLTKGLSYLFGEIFPIAVFGVYLPMWFVEGDAVTFETSVGHLGRGRSPEFLNEMKAQIVEKGLYSFHKAVLGSNKDYVPNRYNMGYYMVSNTRHHYGSDIWGKAIERSGRRPYGINPFDKSLTLSIGNRRDSLWNTSSFRALFHNPDSVKKANYFYNTKRMLYRDNYSELQQIWKREAANCTHTFDTVPTHNKYYTNYYYPTALGKDTVLAYKMGLQETGSFVMLTHGKEKRITRTGLLYDYKFATDRKRIVWSEYRSHLRWEQAGKMRISSYDIKRKKYTRLRGRNNQFSPFKAGDKWGYVETDRQNRSYLVLTDSTLKHELWRMEAEDNEQFIHPSYHNGKILTVVQAPAGIRLESIDITTHNREKITQDIYYELDNPQPTDTNIIYRASYNGNNALYSLQNGTHKKILDSKFGLRFPSFDSEENRLYFSFYTSDGYKPGTATPQQLTSEAVDYTTYPLADEMAKQEQWQQTFTYDSVFPTRCYNKLTHLVNLHSWAPIYASLSPMEVDLGATIYSQNKLSTLTFTAGYVRQSGYKHGNWLLNLTYSGWWPILSVEFESGREDFQSFADGLNLQTGQKDALYVFNKSQRSSADFVIQFPFNLSSRQYNSSLRPYLRYQIEGIHHQRPKQVYGYELQENTAILYPVQKQDYHIYQANRYYQLMEYGLTYSNQTRMTEQEINPRWGQMLTGGFTHALTHGLNLGQQWWIAGRLYLPGFCVNHSLSLYGGFQHMSGKTRNYSNKISYPRGISLNGYEIATFRGSYHLPLLFPDWHISSLLYFKQIDGCFFIDLGSSLHRLDKYIYSSYGIELTTDTHLFRLTYPIHVGVRTGYETQTKRMFGELLFSIGLSI